MTEIGDLDRRFVIRRRADGQLSDGQPVDDWIDVASVWGNLKGQTGLGAIENVGSMPLAVTLYSLRIRYRTGLAAGMRVYEYGTDGQVNEVAPFRVKGVLPDKARRTWTDLVLELGGSDG